MAAALRLQPPPGIAAAAESTIPAASDVGDDLAVGSSAIGQGKVQATTLQMALVAATIALKGKRPRADAALARPPPAGADDAGHDARTSPARSSS